DFMLGKLGFTGIVFDPEFDYTVKQVDTNPLRGYVIANGIEQNGRLLGFVYAGEPDGIPEYDTWKQSQQGPPHPASRPLLPPALSVFVDAKLMEKSINWMLIDAGLAYAELYTSMPLDLLRHMAKRVRELRAQPPANSIWGRESASMNQRFVWNKRIDSLSE